MSQFKHSKPGCSGFGVKAILQWMGFSEERQLHVSMLVTPSHGGSWRAVACRRLVHVKAGPCSWGTVQVCDAASVQRHGISSVL